MRAVLKVSRSGYYGWRGRKESRRNQENRALLIEVEKVHSQSRQAYGALKTWRELKAQGVKCGRHRVARLRRKRVSKLGVSDDFASRLSLGPEWW